jgi:proteasome lid subunit RPN8/RPN11
MEQPRPHSSASSDEPNSDSQDDDEIDIVLGEETALLHDTSLSAKADVRIDVEVHREIEAFAFENRNRECAGLMLGTVEVEGGSRIIHITAAAAAENAPGTRASVSISLPAWETMYRVRDLDYSHLRILGWFHTHAGWGVFMSDSDVFIHRHFFPHPNMVAYVLDPTAGRDGFFYWHEGKIGLCPSYGLVGNASDLKPNRKAKRELGVRRMISPRVGIAVVSVIVLACLAFCVTSLIPRLIHKGPAKQHSATVVTTERNVSADRIYTLGRRDNPWKICNSVYHDGDLARPLMEYNGLSDVAGLQIGQRIKLPPEETLRKLARKQ